MTLYQLANRSREERPIVGISTVATAALRRPLARLVTGLRWFDEALGGGFVRGTIVMVHGDPGAGKSTALAQAAGAVRGALYVTNEEDVSAVAARAQRVGADFELFSSTDMPALLSVAGRAPLLIVDSIQAMEPGAVAATELAVAHARKNNVCVVLICHETKSGIFAGLRTLEHLIDAAIRISRGPPRLIVTEKNRNGPAGVSIELTMTERGLR